MLTKPLALLLLAGALQGQAVTDPFLPGERWSWAPDAQTPWIPRSVALVGRGEWVWTAPSHANAGVALLATGDTSATPLQLTWDWTGATGAVEVRTAGPPRGLFALGGFPAPGGRRFELRRYDAEHAARGNAFGALWTKNFGFRGRVLWEVDDTGRVFVAAESATAAVVDLMEVDGFTGTTVGTTSLASANLRALSISADGARRVVLAGLGLELVDDLGTLGTWTTGAVQSALELDESGTKLAFGDVGRAQVWQERGAGFVHLFDVPAFGNEVVTRLDWSEDGSTLAVGFWDSVSTDVRVSVRDAGGSEVFAFSQAGGTWQNYLADLDLDRTGTRLAIGTWGDVGATSELFLIDLPTQAKLFVEDLGGSVDDLELSDDGTRVVVAFREAHANQLSTRGTLAQFDTGERALALTGASRAGGELRASVRLPAPGVGLFLLGHESTTGWDAFGLGPLFLDPAGPTTWILGTAVSPLRSDLALTVPASSALVGVPWVLHAGGVTPAGPYQAPDVVFPRVL